MIQPFLCALLLAIPSPNPGHRVLDQANLLSQGAESRLEALSAEIDRATTAEIAVVTVNSLDGMSVEQYSNELFNEWGIGKKAGNNGVLLLVALKERRARIEVGYGIEPVLPDGICGQILATEATPYFKKKDYEAGILAAAEEIARILNNAPREAAGIDGSTPSRRPANSLPAVLAALFLAASASGIALTACRRRRFPKLLFEGISGTLMLGLLLILWRNWAEASGTELTLMTLMPLGAQWFIARQFMQIHRCPQCGRGMDLLGEAEDDRYLEVGERLEEKIGSVDYKIWICPICLTKDKEAHINFLMNHLPCPKCNRRAYSVSSTVEVAATTISTGMELMTGSCKACDHTVTRQREIPMIDPVVIHYDTPSTDIGSASSSYDSGNSYSSDSSSSSSSGGGDFGGGSSGGGGASSSW